MTASAVIAAALGPAVSAIPLRQRSVFQTIDEMPSTVWIP